MYTDSHTVAKLSSTHSGGVGPAYVFDTVFVRPLHGVQLSPCVGKENLTAYVLLSHVNITSEECPVVECVVQARSFYCLWNGVNPLLHWHM